MVKVPSPTRMGLRGGVDALRGAGDEEASERGGLPDAEDCTESGVEDRGERSAARGDGM